MTKDEKRAYNKRYHQAHKAEMSAYYQSRKDQVLAKARTPKGRAYRFLHSNLDCTSSAEEIEAIYSASIDMTTGMAGKIGNGAEDLVLDHVHGGPAIGLIPSWMNNALSERMLSSRWAFEGVLDLHEDVANAVAGRIAWG